MHMSTVEVSGTGLNLKLVGVLRLMALRFQCVHGAVQVVFADNDSPCACSTKETDFNRLGIVVKIGLQTMGGRVAGAVGLAAGV